MLKGLSGPYRLSSVRPATMVGRAKGRSMTALTRRLPMKSSRTSTQAITTPASELNRATPREHNSVNLRAATASGWLTAAQNADHPELKALEMMAATGRMTSRLR